MNLEKVNLSELVFKIEKKGRTVETVTELLKNHPEIQFVSYVGVDFGGNGTDERIPVSLFLEDMDKQLKLGVQTDGSSVVLHGIATLDNAKVIILPDRDVDWYVDYNYNNMHFNGKFVGTLIIPSFLIHDNKMVCSRSLLKKSADRFKREAIRYVDSKPGFKEEVGITADEKIEEIVLTSATELEFWVKTPEDKADEEKLSVSQMLKEQYWKRTDGSVRSALEKTLEIMEHYGFEPEMGHKEVGGIKSKINVTGKLNHVMEQLEIDWKYSTEMHAADIEVIVRHLIKDIFHKYELEVTFRAKPIEGVAGSGKHTHIGVAAKLDSGRRVNLFTHADHKNNYASSFAISTLMGILKNYEVINPFVANSIDSLNRLKPHFEAPICIVSSLGKSVKTPSRNRSILIGLIKDIESPLATRFELRAPNPHSNVYLILAACYQAMLDGLVNAGMKMTLEELVEEFSKDYGADGIYLEKYRQYRSEENVFDYYSQEERNERFGVPPGTVYDNIKSLELYPEKLQVLKEDDIFTDAILNSYRMFVEEKWLNQLNYRIIEDNMEVVRDCMKVHNETEISDLDIVNWTKVNSLRWELMKDSVDNTSVFTMIKEAIDNKDFERISELQLEMNDKVSELKSIYSKYKKNLF
ncbi:MAG: glutamine synthetase [Clostridia bacterium]|nr:glutamine synthetase [Clostridia bacterium]